MWIDVGEWQYNDSDVLSWYCYSVRFRCACVKLICMKWKTWSQSISDIACWRAPECLKSIWIFWWKSSNASNVQNLQGFLFELTFYGHDDEDDGVLSHNWYIDVDVIMTKSIIIIKMMIMKMFMIILLMLSNNGDDDQWSMGFLCKSSRILLWFDFQLPWLWKLSKS